MKRAISLLLTFAIIFTTGFGFPMEARAAVEDPFTAEAVGTYSESTEAQEITVRIKTPGVTVPYCGFVIDGRTTLPEGWTLVKYTTSNTAQPIVAGDYTTGPEYYGTDDYGKLTYMTSDTEDTIPADTYYDAVFSVPANTAGTYEIVFNKVNVQALYGSNTVAEMEKLTATVTITELPELEEFVVRPTGSVEESAEFTLPIEEEIVVLCAEGLFSDSTSWAEVDEETSYELVGGPYTGISIAKSSYTNFCEITITTDVQPGTYTVRGSYEYMGETYTDDFIITINAAPAAEEIVITKDGDEVTEAIDVVLPVPGAAASTVELDAVVYDQYDDVMDVTVAWSVSGPSDKVTVNADGTVSVQPGAAEGNYTVTVTYTDDEGNTVTDTVVITVAKAKLVATSIKIYKDGKEITADSIVIPETGLATAIYTAKVFDQYGEEMNAGCTYSISGGSAYVSVAATDAGAVRVMVQAGATAGVYKLTADYNGVTAELPITLSDMPTQADFGFYDENGNEITAMTKTWGDADFTLAATGSETGLVSYESSDPTVATVDANGKVTILKVGETTITAISGGNHLYATTTASYVLTVVAKKINIPESDLNGYVYNGQEQTYIIAPSEYYEVSGNKQTDAGTYTVTVTLKDTLNTVWTDGTTEPKTYEFVIQAKPINWEGMTVEDIADVTYTGSAHTPAVVVKDGETVLVEGTDYSVEYVNNIDAGTATAIISGMGNYTGKYNKEFTIAKAPITVEVSIISWIYGDAANTPSVTGNSGNGAVTYTYKVKGADDSTYTASVPTAAGDYVVKAVVAETRNYLGGEDTAEFSIEAKDLSNATIGDVSDYTYDGNAKTPTPSVTLGNKTLTAGVDFDYSYSNNVNAGTATVTVTGKGNYAGIASKTFTINPAEQTINGSNITIKVGNSKDLSALFSAMGRLSFSIEGSDATGSVISGTTLTAGETVGTFTLKVTAEAVQPNYKQTSKTFTVTVVAKDEQVITVANAENDALTFTYGDEDAAISAETNVDAASISYAVTSGTDVITVDAQGNITLLKVGTAVITVTASETEDYAETTKTITVTVLPKQITAPAADTKVYTYNGSEQTYGISSTADYTVSGNVQTDAGDYTVIVELVDKENTVWADSKDAANKEYGFEIHKADLTVKANSYEIQVGEDAPVLDEDSYVVSGLLGNDTIENIGLNITVAYSETPDTNSSGSYAIIVSGDASTKNYTVTYINGTLTVENDAIEVSPVDPEDPDQPDDPTEGHACPVCGGCVDADCQLCEDKCLLLTMNFTDVENGKWYTEGVEYVYHRGLMIGTSDTLFEINGTTNRAMVVTILWRMAGKPTGGANPFTDVPAGQWYTEAVIWAASEGIVNGYGDGRFGPMDSITREQMAKILRGYAEYKGFDVSERADLSKFADADKISGWAEEYLSWAVAEGLVQGVGDNRVDPQGFALRSQVATLIMRFCQSILGAK